MSDLILGTFPPSFVWGMANSSYQTEGGWDEDGKGESIWDRFCHQDPSPIKDGGTGDMAMDSYHKYKEDVKLLKDINAKMYRFSLSWPRILPQGGIDGVVNQAGIDYYNKLIDELIANGIEPCVTLFHWDLPQALQETLQGWTNPELIQHFVDYARLCFKSFGDRVKTWITFNEPYIFVMKGYDYAAFAPGIKEPLETPYKVVHNMLQAHAVAYRIYEKEFKSGQAGRVGLAIDSSNYSPMDGGCERDREGVDKAYEFRIGWIANPLFYGDYPEKMKEAVSAQSKKEGLATSRLPEFDPTASTLLKGAVDFIGLNYYTSELVQPLDKLEDPTLSATNTPGWNRDLGLDRIRDPGGKRCGVWWQRIVPHGLRRTLNWIRERYGNPPVIITENGMGEGEEVGVEDEGRVDFFKGHINETLKAVKLDGCNVQGYLGWCLLDVFEWADGYTVGFGVHQVDRTNPTEMRRTPKKSAKYLAKIFKDNGFI